MANEISLSTSLSSTMSGLTVSGSGSLAITQSGAPMLAAIQIVGTTTEAIAIGDITDIGYLFLKNNDATNFVEISTISPVVTGTSLITLKAGESCAFPTRLETIYAKADTASCNVQVVAISR